MREKTILIVDDEPVFIEKIHDVLSQKNYRLLFAGNSQIAIKLAIDKHPDLIIMDWELPEMSGIDIIRILKDYSETQFTPIIMCTGKMTTSHDLQQALESGAVDYIQKPIDEIELLARVNSSLLLSQLYAENKEKQARILEQEKRILEQQNERLSSELAQNKKELEMMLSRMLHNSESQNKLFDSIVELIANEDKVLRNQITRLMAEYRPEMKNNFWEEFYVRFQNNDKEFEKRLRERCPSLTQNDVKICIFLRNNMSSKEISLLTFSNYENIRKARIRLRKKFNLTHEEDLYSYISSI